MSLLGALPARFRRERVLIVGCGDVGMRAAGVLAQGRRLMALTSTPARREALRAAGITPLLGDLDDASSLGRLAGIATRVLHLAPPPGHPADGRRDPRTAALTRALARRTAPKALVYGSTTGVYGDQRGRWVDETTPVSPRNARAWRRVDAEAEVRALGRRASVRVTVLRIPGIYAMDRPGGMRERLLRGTPVLRPEDDVFTNHIHADDLARACVLALWRGQPQRVIHAVDRTELRMGECLDRVADHLGLARPTRVPRAGAEAVLGPMALSFMEESRRLRNHRLVHELRLTLRYPTVLDGWVADVSPVR